MSVIGAFAVPHPPIIVSEIGRGEERRAAKTDAACREAAARCARLKPDALIVFSPHSVLYRDYFHISPGRHARGDFGAFGRPDLAVETDYDAALAREIAGEAKKAAIPAGTLGERDSALDHGAMIPLLYFFGACGRLPVVRVGLSGFSLYDHYRFGQAVARAAESLGRRAAIVASGDLSHKLKADGPYGFAPEGPVFDARVMEALGRADFCALMEFDPVFREKAAECGLRSFAIMAGAFDGFEVKAEALSYEGPFGVGYGVACFEPLGKSEARRCGERFLRRARSVCEEAAAKNDAYVRLARRSLEHFVATGRVPPSPPGLPPRLTDARAGVFVSIKKFGELRGCVGTIYPAAESIADEIARNAVSAGTRDPRFEPVTEQELPYLIYDVDVLGAPEPAGRGDLDPKRWGVIVASGERRGLLLPDLDGVDTVERQLDIALRKAGIGRGEKYSIERFEVERHV